MKTPKPLATLYTTLEQLHALIHSKDDSASHVPYAVVVLVAIATGNMAIYDVDWEQIEDQVRTALEGNSA